MDAEGSRSKAPITLLCLIPVASLPPHTSGSLGSFCSRFPSQLHTCLTALFTGPQAQLALPHDLLSPALLLGDKKGKAMNPAALFRTRTVISVSERGGQRLWPKQANHLWLQDGQSRGWIGHSWD